MDKKTLKRLVKSGAIVEDMGRKPTDVELLGEALIAQGDKLREVIKQLADMPAPEPAVVNVDVKPQKPQPISAPVSVNVPSKPPLKGIKFRVTGRDMEGNLKEFEAVPEYEITH